MYHRWHELREIYRRKHGFIPSFNFIAETMGMGLDTILRFSKNQDVTTSTYVKLAQFFGTSVSRLFKETEDTFYYDDET